MRGGAAALLAALLWCGVPTRAVGGPGLAGVVEDEFEAAIKAINPATVFCVAPKKFGPSPGSSGVLVTRDGYVLSDGDAGAYYKPVPGPDGRPRPEKAHADEIEVRVPDLKRGTYTAYVAKRVRRVESIDTSLLKIENPPATGFPFVVPGASGHLAVGRFTFAVGTSFPQGDSSGSSSLTAGVVASLKPLEPGDPAGAWAEIVTSAAVNPGVNGGPLVDANGSLVGIISTWGQATPDDPFQFLGKAFPIDRIRYAYRDLPNFATVFPDPRTLPVRARQTAMLETAIAAAVTKASRSVVSLEVTRKTPLATKVANRPVGRYQGPTSGVVVSEDGWVVASLYAFADTLPISVSSVMPGPPPDAAVAADLGEITGVTAWLPRGRSAPARVVSHHQRLGLVLLKVDLPDGDVLVPVESLPSSEIRSGRLVLGVSDPFGKDRRPHPLVSLGMVSRLHPEDGLDAWGGCFQTDANLTDGTAGGALVDVRGRFLGLATLWLTVQHGRNSGIGFGVPWSRIEAALPAMKAGESFLVYTAMMRVTMKPDAEKALLDGVEPGGPAEAAGLKAGDRILAVDGKVLERTEHLRLRLRYRRPGDEVVVAYERNGKRAETKVVLAGRPAATVAEPEVPPPPPPPAAMSDAP